MIGELNAKADGTDTQARSDHRPLWWILLLGLYLTLVFQGSRGLWSPDEGRYVGVALQMMDSGNYLAPAYSPAELNFSKPPLTYWVIAASLHVFGRTTWAARTPYALCFVVTLALLFLMGRRASPNKPWLPSLIYATTAFPYLTANIVSTDVLLTLFETLAVLGFVLATWPQHEAKRRLGPAVMWLGFGLAFLTKGPPGLLPLLSITVFSVVCGDWRALVRLFHPIGVAIFVLIGLGWYALAMLRYPWLLHYFLHDEVYGRIFTSMHRRHAGAMGWALVYLPVLVVGTLPWWRSLFTALRDTCQPAAWRRLRRERSLTLFLTLWFGIPLIIFCLSQSRLPLYLLPLFAPLALLAASRLEYTFDLRNSRTQGVLAGWISLLLAVKGYAAYGITSRDDNQRAAGEIAAQIVSSDYSAVIFLEDNDDTYAVEEQTPWGVRLYLNKPIYGVSGLSAQAPAQLCAAIEAQGNALIVIDRELPDMYVDTMIRECTPNLQRMGHWRGDALVLAHH
ncbi:glycosyltransferase family 39 protein [Dyella sp. ASV21]|uniref:ArnT family glycosyltransferase n=1 Tax=Dyella sp. ASV21 TaxID=2795114 RepID=UPI0018EC2520|nr:glycosyltransferase family 39 protein [Dyella sp. ASV21]